MEKVIEKKEASKTNDVKVNAEYVKLADMVGKDILALPRFNGNLVKEKSKRGKLYYKLVVEIDPLLKIERTLLEKEFNLIVLERKLRNDLPIQGFVVPVRLLSGKSDKDREWFRYEFFVSKNFTINEFFDSTDVALIHAANLKLDFIKSNEKFSDDLITMFNDEDFY